MVSQSLFNMSFVCMQFLLFDSKDVKNLCLSELGSNSNEGVLHISPNSNTGALLSDGLTSYPEHSLKVGHYPSAYMHLVYSTALADWVIQDWNLWRYYECIPSLAVTFYYNKQKYTKNPTPPKICLHYFHSIRNIRYIFLKINN